MAKTDVAARASTAGNVSAAADADMAYLRQGSLEAVLVCAIFGLYLWCAVLFHLWDLFGPPWLGPGLLIVGLVVAYACRDRRTSVAAAALVASIALADLHAMWMTGVGIAPYVLAVVVSLTGLLFSLGTVTWVTILCSIAVIAVGSLRWGQPVFSPGLMTPVFIIGAVGILSSLGVRNLYEALYWFQERAAAAQRNERQLHDRQAQLARTVKALDESYRRLEVLNYDLARAREVAEQAREVKQRFVMSVSHELRTPLNVITAFSETMYLSPESYGGVPLPPEYRGDVREVYRSSRHLLRLIDDVLNMSRMEAGQMRIRQEPVDLYGVVVEAVDHVPVLGGWILGDRQHQAIAGVAEAVYWEDPTRYAIEAHRALDVDGMIMVTVPDSPGAYRGEFYTQEKLEGARERYGDPEDVLAYARSLPSAEEALERFDAQAWRDAFRSEILAMHRRGWATSSTCRRCGRWSSPASSGTGSLATRAI